MKKCLRVLIASLLSGTGVVCAPVSEVSIEAPTEIKREEGKIEPGLKEHGQEVPSLIRDKNQSPQSRSVDKETAQKVEQPAITVAEVPEERSSAIVVTEKKLVSDTLLQAWNNKNVTSALPAVRFAQAAQRVDLLATVENLKAGSLKEDALANPDVRSSLKEKYDGLKKIDAVLKRISDDALRYAESMTLTAKSEEILTTSMTLAALASLRREIAQEQRKIFDYLKMSDKLRVNNFTPLVENFSVTTQSFAHESQLEETKQNLQELRDKILAFDARSLFQTTTLQRVLPERQAIRFFLDSLVRMRSEVVSQKYTGDSRKLNDAITALDELIDKTNILLRKVTTQWNLSQSKTFTTKVNDLFERIKKFLEFISLKVTTIAGTVKDISEGKRLEADAWNALAESLSSTSTQAQLKEAYDQFAIRLDELENFIDSTSAIVTELRQQPLTLDQKRVLLALRSALEGYLSTLSVTAKMMGVRIDNPTELGSHLLTFVSSWYRSTGESITKDDLTIAQNVSGSLGDGQQLIKRLDGQASDAAALLKIIDSDILKQATLGAKSLYAFSFIGTLLATMSGSITWVMSLSIGMLDKLGSVINVKYQNLLLPAPVLTMGAAVLFESFAYALQNAALKFTSK